MPVTKLLIANRGEISCRAQRACAELSIPCVAVFAAPDALSLHVLRAAESVCLGAAPKEYLNADRLLEVAAQTGCDAVFPGYGFLSENAEFAERCEKQGIAFIGPTADTMRQFSQKHTARALAEGAGVPVLPGTSLLSSGEEALAAAQSIGLPVLLKATGGGGGIGIHICRTEEEVVDKFQSAARQGAASFGDAGVFVEKYVQVREPPTPAPRGLFVVSFGAATSPAPGALHYALLAGHQLLCFCCRTRGTSRSRSSAMVRGP
jgi:urea carboxylase